MQLFEQSGLCKLEIFIPVSHLEPLRDALQAAGAGRLGNYDGAMSYAPVTGCWRPLPGAAPFTGAIGQPCEAAEYKVEVCCPVANLARAVAAIRAMHPYEEPVINVIPLWKV